MEYKIFLDDLRMPTDIYPNTNNGDWLIIRNLTDFKKTILEKGVPEFISFDNDLGDSMEEGKHAAKWMTYDMELNTSNMEFKVHSANSGGPGGPKGDIASWFNNWNKELTKRKIEDKNKLRMEVRKILVTTWGQPFLAATSNLKEYKEIRMKFNIPVPSDILTIKTLLKKRGYKLYVVGGAVRDALLNKQPKDFDLATDALPGVVQEILSKFYKTLETGKAFGIINVLTPTGEYEVATFRKDLSGGRRPDAVEFTTIDQDVLRRDLTINALFYDIDKSEIVDLVGGIEDLKNGIVRTVGSAEERFNEDRLRILRAIRFAARFGSELDPAADAALKINSSLEGISGERIRDEFIKGIKSAKSVIHFLGLLQRYDLFKWVFGSLKYRVNFIEEHDVPVLLSYLLVDNNVDSLKGGLNSLKYSADEITQISFLNILKNLDIDNVFKLKKAQANSKLTDEQIRKFANWMKMNTKLLEAFLKFKTTITGKELIDQGFIGKAIGDEMEMREIENFKKLLNN